MAIEIDAAKLLNNRGKKDNSGLKFEGADADLNRYSTKYLDKRINQNKDALIKLEMELMQLNSNNSINDADFIKKYDSIYAFFF